jgi:hypothetical protein
VSVRYASLFGFAVATTIPPIVLAIFAVVSAPEIRNNGLLEGILLFSISFIVFLPYSVLFVLFLGVPSFILCRRLGLVRWWAALIVGMLIGVLVSIAVRAGSQAYWEVFFKFVPTAAAAALAFWVVWNRGTRLPAHSNH